MRIERCSTPAAFDLATASRQSVADVFHRLGTTEEGLTSDEAATGRRTFGANVLASHRVTAFGVFVRQIRNPLLILLLVAAAVSATTGDITDAGIIAAIVTLSVGLGLRLFADGARVVAVATRDASGLVQPVPGDERDLHLAGFLTFVDRPKADVGASIAKLNHLGIAVKIITGDNGTVAAKVCRDIGLDVQQVVTGAELERLGDDDLASAIPQTTGSSA